MYLKLVKLVLVPYLELGLSFGLFDFVFTPDLEPVCAIISHLLLEAGLGLGLFMA